MTRQQHIDQFRHAISGLILDLFHGEPRGAELSVKMRGLLKQIDSRSGDFYDALIPPVPLPVNGNGQTRKVTP